MGEDEPLSPEGIKRQVRRFRKFKEAVDKAKDEGHEISVIGDLNIDQWQENDPMSRPELRALQPVLDDLILTNSLTLMNTEPTRHMRGQKSSLLDLVLVSDEYKIKGLKNLKTGLSDHDGVIFSYLVKSLVNKPQFTISRDYSQITASNLMPLIDNSHNLQSLFSQMDPDNIALMLKDGMDQVINKLITKKRYQRRKNETPYDDHELREIRKEVKLLNKKATNLELVMTTEN